MSGKIVRAGQLKKLKTSRKKWFVLRAETAESAARLEYYDSEKKFIAGQPPKRSIPLRTCFNINKRHDIKHKHVIALYTKDDCFCVVLDNEEELDSWLKSLLSLQHGDDVSDGEVPRPTFEHVWQVLVQNRGLGTGITGEYRLCLTAKTLSFISKDNKNRDIHFPMTQVRSSGSLKSYFFLEVGRNSILGAGEIWMNTEDSNIAQNIHTTLLHRTFPSMGEIENSSNDSNDKPFYHSLLPQCDKDNEIRSRSSSATETSKPAAPSTSKKQFGFLKQSFFSHASGGRPTITHQRTHSLPLAGDRNAGTSTMPPPVPCHPPRVIIGVSSIGYDRKSSLFKSRDRCDSMPAHSAAAAAADPLSQPGPSGLQQHPHKLPSVSTTPPSAGCSSTGSSTGGSTSSLATDEMDGGACCSATSDYAEAVRYPMPLTPDEAIAEEDCPDSPPCGMDAKYVPMHPQSSDDDGYVDMSPRLRNHYLHSPGIVSGTPSTDIRFADYPLDKVVSYLAEEHDDSRPLRAYSVGSRTDTFNKGKRPIETAATTEEDDDARVRSFSTGSKVKRGPSRVLPHYQHPGAKSNSAPILLNSRSYSCHSSNDPMDNLMEMDFSRGSNNTLNNNSPKTPSGYVEMKPGVEIAPKKPFDSSYMDMNRHHHPHHHPTNNNYVDMEKGKGKSRPWNGDYLDMSANQARRSDRGSSFGSHTSSSSSPRNGDYASTCFAQQEAAKTPEGYVEMTPGRGHNRQSSLDGAQSMSTNEDYLNMSCASKKKTSKKEKAASQPITIKSVAAHNSAKGSSSPISISSLLGRKSSTGTPPKMHLPLTSLSSPYASLPRQRARKDSKDSSGSSGVGTPSSSSTIFPMSLNSPSSPMKPTKSETSSSALKFPAAIFNAFCKNNNKSNIASNVTNSEDYAYMDFSAKKGKENNLSKDTETNKKGKKVSDYVNYAPAPAATPTTSSQPMDGDYLSMKPGEASGAKTSVPVKPMGHLSLAADKKGLNVKGFRPIQEDGSVCVDEEMPIVKPKDPASVVPEEPASAPFNECVSPAAKISRPNSVNGESAKTTSSSSSASGNASIVEAARGVTACEPWANAPAPGADSDRAGQQPDKLHYASLDLAQPMEEDESSSPRAAQRRGSPGGAESSSQGEQTFLYAEIDFLKSEGLKQNTNSNQSLLNAKVKH